MTNILEFFLLFDVPTFYKYGDAILRLCQLSLIPLFIMALIFTILSARPDPLGVLKGFIISQTLLITIPIYYKDVAGFGLKVGNSLLKDQKTGIVSHWVKHISKVEERLDKSDFVSIIGSFFDSQKFDIVDKGALFLIMLCVLILKLFYSACYYGTYFFLGIFATLSILPPCAKYLNIFVQSTLYLILTAIIVALVLTFLNVVLVINVGGNGFINNLSDMVKFFVLCLLLLGSLKIGHSLVSGEGFEGWAGGMSNMLSAGIAYKAIGIGMNASKSGGSEVLSKAIKAGSLGLNALNPVAGAAMYMASRPLAVGMKGVKSNLQTSLNSSVGNIANNEGNFKRSNLLKGRYESAFKNIANQKGVTGAINPINHIKAAKEATKGLSKELYTRGKQNLGLPASSEHLSMKEKSIFIANQLLKEPPKPNKKELLESLIIANKITGAIDRGKKND